MLYKAASDKTQELFSALLQNDLERVKKLILKGADVNIQDNDGNTPVHIAVRNLNFGLKLTIFMAQYANFLKSSAAGAMMGALLYPIRQAVIKL